MKRLVLGPGSMAVYAIFGLLKRLENDCELEDLEEISAASAGSLAAFSYLCTVTVEKALAMDLASIIKPKIRNLVKKGAFIDTSELVRELKGVSTETFMDMYKRTGIKLHISVTSIDRRCSVYLSVDSAPDMLVADAVLASMSIPLLFPPHLGYLDGALTEELPVGPFIGLEAVAVRIDDGDPPPMDGKPLSTLRAILYMLFSMRSTYGGKVIDLRIPRTISIYNFNMSKDDMLRMFLAGWAAPG